MGTNRTWLTVYSPLAFTGGSQNGGALLVSPLHELGISTYSVYVNIPAGQTATLQLNLSGRLQTGSTYALTFRNQPMVFPDQLKTTVSTPTGWAELPTPPSPWSPGTQQQQTRTVHFAKIDT